MVYAYIKAHNSASFQTQLYFDVQVTVHRDKFL